MGALVADLPFVAPRSRTQFCDAIVRQMRSPHSHLKMFLHLATQHGTMLLEMTSQSAGVGSKKCVILIGREVSSGLAGLVVNQSSAAPLESASDGDDEVFNETISESAPSNVSADLGDDMDVDLGELGSSNGPTMSSISDITLPSGIYITPEPSSTNSSSSLISGVNSSSNSNNNNAIGYRKAEATSTSTFTPNPSSAFEARSLPSLPTFDDESVASTVDSPKNGTDVVAPHAD